MNHNSRTVDLTPEHSRIVLDVLRQHVPDRKILVFGSRASGCARQYSDLDLAIIGDEPLTLDISAILREAFSDSDLPFKVDFVDWAQTDESFRDIIGHSSIQIHPELVYN